MRLIFALLLLTTVAAPAQQPRRIVSTAPSFSETLYALGVGDRVMAVSAYCHYPPEVEKLPRIGSYLNPNIESIVRMKPDLVLVHAEQAKVIEQFRKFAIPTLPLKNTSLDEALASIVEIGKAVGVRTQGAALERTIRTRLSQIEQRSIGKPRRTLLFVVGRTPGRLDGLVAVGKGSFLNEVIRIAGGRNVLSNSPVTYPRISLEAVIRLDPDVIVDMGDMAVTTGVTEAHKQSVVQLWESQPAFRAVREKSVFAVAADIFVVPGPRIAETAEAFQRMLFGSGGR